MKQAKSKTRTQEIEFKDGEYYEGKGYFWKGEFIISNSDPKAYDLGYYHGQRIIKNLTKSKIRRLSRRKPANNYEEGKIQALRDFLEKKEERN